MCKDLWETLCVCMDPYKCPSVYELVWVLIRAYGPV